MQNPIKKLLVLIEQKRELAPDLFTAYTMQTELEYDLALIRLEFRYDDEVDWTLYEANMLILSELLNEADAKIIQLAQQLENCSFQIANL